MNVEYRLSKRWLRLAFAVQWMVFLSAAYAVLTDATNSWPAVLAAFVGPLAAFFLREVGGHYYGKGERIRRLHLLQRGLGIEPSDVDLLEVYGSAHAIKPEAMPIGDYYSSHYAPGPQRLLHQLQESAYWSNALASLAMRVHYTLAALGLTGTAAMAFWALHKAASQAGPTEVDFSRLFSLLVIFFLAGSTLANARSYHALARSASQIIERASRLRKQAGVEAVEMYKVLSAYDSALAKAPPIPTYAYSFLQKKLTSAWDAVRALEKPSLQTVAVAAEEPTRATPESAAS